MKKGWYEQKQNLFDCKRQLTDVLLVLAVPLCAHVKAARGMSEYAEVIAMTPDLMCAVMKKFTPLVIQVTNIFEGEIFNAYDNIFRLPMQYTHKPSSPLRWL